MGETTPARRLVGGADVVPDVHRDLREPVVLAEDHGEAVPQLVLLELQLGVLGEDRHRAERGGDDQGSAEHVRPPSKERLSYSPPIRRASTSESQARASAISAGTTMCPIGYSR